METNESSAPLILTLKLDEHSQSFFDLMRERHFPPERNFIPAHVSLFHNLPGRESSGISSDIEEVCREQGPFTVRVEKMRMLGKGVAYVLSSPELNEVRAELAGRWKHWLTPQDSQKFGGHVTIQNKVTPERAKALYRDLEATFQPFDVRAEGLLLWWYAGGPWKPESEFVFER